MSIEQHHEHPAPSDTGAVLASLFEGLTLTMLQLPDPDPVVETVEETPVDVPQPRAERRHGNVLNELGFLDD